MSQHRAPESQKNSRLGRYADRQHRDRAQPQPGKRSAHMQGNSLRSWAAFQDHSQDTSRQRTVIYELYKHRPGSVFWTSSAAKYFGLLKNRAEGPLRNNRHTATLGTGLSRSSCTRYNADDYATSSYPNLDCVHEPGTGKTHSLNLV